MYVVIYCSLMKSGRLICTGRSWEFCFAMFHRLNAEDLRLHLDTHNLVTTSRLQELVERLLRWHEASHQKFEQEGGSETDPEPDHTHRQYWEARTTVAAQKEATTMGKQMGKQIHCPRKLAGPTRMGTMHMVSTLGILTRNGNTPPITSMMESMPASISNIACIISVSRHMPQ